MEHALLQMTMSFLVHDVKSTLSNETEKKTYSSSDDGGLTKTAALLFGLISDVERSTAEQ